MPTAKNRVDLSTDIDNIITDGGALTAQELRDLLKDILTSMVNVEDDIVPGAHSALREYKAGDIVTYNERTLVCHSDIAAKTFDGADWFDITRRLRGDAQQLTESGGTIDLSTLTELFANEVYVTTGGASATITAINGGIPAYNGKIFRFKPATGKTITFTHTAVGGLGGGNEMVHKGGANLALVGRSGEHSDWIEYLYDSTTGAFFEVNSAIYP